MTQRRSLNLKLVLSVLAAFLLSMAFTGFEFPFKGMHAFTRFTAVNFEFGFTGATSANAACQAAHRRVLINELR